MQEIILHPKFFKSLYIYLPHVYLSATCKKIRVKLINFSQITIGGIKPRKEVLLQSICFKQYSWKARQVSA